MRRRQSEPREMIVECYSRETEVEADRLDALAGGHHHGAWQEFMCAYFEGVRNPVNGLKGWVGAAALKFENVGLSYAGRQRLHSALAYRPPETFRDIADWTNMCLTPGSHG